MFVRSINPSSWRDWFEAAPTRRQRGATRLVCVHDYNTLRKDIIVTVVLETARGTVGGFGSDERKEAHPMHCQVETNKRHSRRYGADFRVRGTGCISSRRAWRPRWSFAKRTMIEFRHSQRRHSRKIIEFGSSVSILQSTCHEITHHYCGGRCSLEEWVA